MHFGNFSVHKHVRLWLPIHLGANQIHKKIKKNIKDQFSTLSVNNVDIYMAASVHIPTNLLCFREY